MGKLQLSCPRCERPFWAGDELAGRRMSCPHCGGEIWLLEPCRRELAGLEGEDVIQFEDLRGEDLRAHHEIGTQIDGGANRGTKEAGGTKDEEEQAREEQMNLLRSQWAQKLEQKEAEVEALGRELAQTKEVLVESLQQFRQTRHELEKIRSEAEAAEKSNLSLNTRLKLLENDVAKAQVLLQGAQSEVSDANQRLEDTKAQRNAYLWESQRLEAAFQETQGRIETLEKDRDELREVLRRANQNTESFQKERLMLSRELEAIQSRLDSALQELSLSESARSEAEAERDRLTRELRESQDASFIQSAESRMAEMERELGSLHEQSSVLRRKYEIAEQERTELKESNANLRIQLASAREVIGGCRLQQENEQLRAVLERANEQIRVLAKTERPVQYVPLNEPFEPEEDHQPISGSLRWLQAILAKWGHSV